MDKASDESKSAAKNIWQFHGVRDKTSVFSMCGACMRCWAALLTVMVLLAAAPCAMAAQDSVPAASLDYLLGWAGKEPSIDKKTMAAYPKGQSFWEDSNILAIMKKNLPKELIIRVVAGWPGATRIVEMPIEKKDRILMVTVCKPHFCSMNAARMFFNLDRKTVQVCWTEATGTPPKQADYWISQKVKRLGVDGCKQQQGFDLLRANGDPNY